MSTTATRVLLIEDNPGDVVLVQELLDAHDGFELAVAQTLARGLQQVREHQFDGVLVDLGLPDCQGVQTYVRLYTEVPQTPIIVLTGNDDEELALQAIRAGAQDYLVKSRINADLLVRSLRYGIERHKLLGEIEHISHATSEDRQKRAFSRIAGPQTTVVSSSFYGGKPIRDSAPEFFAEIVERYVAVLEHALEKQVLKIDAPTAPPLRKLAEDLGLVAAGPRDVVDVHTAGLAHKCAGMPPAKARAYSSEGKYLLLELMGYLVSFYRNYFPSSGLVGGKKDHG